MITNAVKLTCIASAVLFLAAPSSFAGGPLELNPNDADNFTRWANGGLNIPYNTDLGSLGPLDNSSAVQQTIDAFQVWEDIPSATATYVNNGPLAVDVDITNFGPFIDNLLNGNNNADGLSPIVYDVDGSIFSALFGLPGILGFASQDTFDEQGFPIEGVSFLNGGEIDAGFPLDQFFGVQVHEFGHYSGLAHTVVNGQSVALGDSSGPSPNNTFGDAPSNQIETMYPFALPDAGTNTLHADDIAFFSTLYPAEDFFTATGSISGTIYAPNGTTPLVGVNVIARNVEAPFVDAVSAISGDRGTPGEYTINGLTPGANYVVFVDQILRGEFSTSPLAFNWAEEFYNGINESNQGDADNPNDRTEITVAANTTISNIDIIFNGLAQNTPLPIGDDGALELSLPFTFYLCGAAYQSVWVNANGNLTFGAADTNPLESAGGMVAGAPRIAGLWDDLDPSSGGSVEYSASDYNVVVRWQDVPEYNSSSSNSFSITLKKRPLPGLLGSSWTINYEQISALDGIAGYSCGEQVTSGFETASDLSNAAPFIIESLFETTLFEQFSPANPVDLANSLQTFFGTTTFRDVFENNDSIKSARTISMPFNSVSNSDTYTKIDPLGDDADYFRFWAQAGQTLIAEITNSAADTTLGLFDSSGNLLSVDDDGGSGTLSQIVFAIPEDGRYFIAVSSFPDLSFTGAGQTAGRYVLDAELINGYFLTLGDDDSVDVALNFPFTYQGQTYRRVFVNANGNLTFGAGSAIYNENLSDLLTGPPRIAMLWDDLSPNQGGIVIVESEVDSTKISFRNVPEFFSPSGNTFAAALYADGSIDIRYNNLSAIDGLAGISSGDGEEDPGATDLSAANIQSAGQTVYEIFSISNPNDLANTDLLFVLEE